MELFKNKKWFKGNLHTHTLESDGLKSVQEAIQIYRDAGYDFIALTDHWKLCSEKSENGFFVIPGVEFDWEDNVRRIAYHIVGLNLYGNIIIKAGAKPGEIIDYIKNNDGLAIIAHPAWSLMSPEDIIKLEGYTGIEIWNNVSETDSGRGDSSVIADIMAARGIYPLIFAVDDTHFYRNDALGAYIMVNSDSGQKEGIIDNIKNGNFYCSQGPSIKQVHKEGKLITVETSPVKEIIFYSNTFYCHDRFKRAEGKEGITKGEYKIKETDKFVRIECRDYEGKRASSQYIRI